MCFHDEFEDGVDFFDGGEAFFDEGTSFAVDFIFKECFGESFSCGSDIVHGVAFFFFICCDHAYHSSAVIADIGEFFIEGLDIMVHIIELEEEIVGIFAYVFIVEVTFHDDEVKDGVNGFVIDIG